MSEPRHDQKVDLRSILGGGQKECPGPGLVMTAGSTLRALFRALRIQCTRVRGFAQASLGDALAA